MCQIIDFAPLYTTFCQLSKKMYWKFSARGPFTYYVMEGMYSLKKNTFLPLPLGGHPLNPINPPSFLKPRLLFQ